MCSLASEHTSRKKEFKALGVQRKENSGCVSAFFLSFEWCVGIGLFDEFTQSVRIQYDMYVRQCSPGKGTIKKIIL